QYSRTVVADDRLEEPPTDIPDGVPCAIGEGALEVLLECDVVVASPGVPRSHPFRERLDDAGVTITTGTAMWLREHAAACVGVTGTKGKSATSSLVAQVLAGAGVDVVLAGNIGAPLLEVGAPSGTV